MGAGRGTRSRPTRSGLRWVICEQEFIRRNTAATISNLAIIPCACCGGIVEVQRRKEFPIEAVTRKQARGLSLGVSANQKIRRDSGSLPSLLPIRPPSTAREEMRFPRQGLYTDLVAFEESIALVLGPEMNAKFCVDNIADHETPFTRRVLQRRQLRIRWGAAIGGPISQPGFNFGFSLRETAAPRRYARRPEDGFSLPASYSYLWAFITTCL